MPNQLQVGEGHVKIVPGAKSHGGLSCICKISKQDLTTSILENLETNTGFLLSKFQIAVSVAFSSAIQRKHLHLLFLHIMVANLYIKLMFLKTWICSLVCL